MINISKSTNCATTQSRNRNVTSERDILIYELLKWRKKSQNELRANVQIQTLYRYSHRHKMYRTCTCYVIPPSLCLYRDMYISQPSPPSQPAPLFVLNALDISHVRFFVWRMLTTCRQLRDPRASTPALSTLCNRLESSSPHRDPRVT